MEDLTRLCLRARDGDHDALDAFVRTSHADVWRLCRHLVGPAAADDATQETFVRAISSIGRFRGESSGRTWLLTIARNTCADVIRRRQRRRRLIERVSAHRIDEGLDAPTNDVVEDLLQRIDTDRRIAFVLTQILGLSYDDAAEVCGIPTGTIRSRVSRARSDLLTLSSQDAPADRERPRQFGGNATRSPERS